MASVLYKQDNFRYGIVDKQLLLQKDGNNKLYGESSLYDSSNFFVNKYGTLSKRYGTKFIAEVKNSNKKTRIIPFSIGVQESYIVELGDQYLRIYSENGIEKDQNNNIIELSTPYNENILDTIYNYEKGGASLYIVHPKYQPYKLTRIKHATYNEWSFQPLQFKIQLDSNGQPIYCGVPTTLSRYQQASSSQLELIIANVSGVDKITSNDQTNYNFESGVIYRLAYIGSSGANVNQMRVVYIKTTSAGNSVTFQVMGGKITSAGDETGVPKQTPLPLWEVEFGKDGSDYPSSICIADQRLLLGSGGDVIGSRLSDYSDFGIYEDSVSQTSPFKISVYRSNYNNFNFLTTQDSVVYGGTDGEIFRMVKSQGSNNAINYSANPVLQESGSSVLRPLTIGSYLLSLERNNIRFRLSSYDYQKQFLNTVELTETNRQIMSSGVKRYCYQNTPNNLILFLKNNNEAIICNFSMSSNLYYGGWSKFNMGDDIIEDLCVIPSKTNGIDNIYFIIKRLVNGVTKRYIEKYNDLFLYDEQSPINFLDCIISVSNRTEERDGVKYIGGFEQLKGREVYVIFNQNDIRATRVVGSDGFIQINETEAINLTQDTIVTCGIKYIASMSSTPALMQFDYRYSSIAKGIKCTDLSVTYQNSSPCSLYDNNDVLLERERSFANNQILAETNLQTIAYQKIINGTRQKHDHFFTLKSESPLPCNIVAIQYNVEI